MVRHYAFIPARAGSKGFPGKNRYFFNFTADFLDSSGLFDGVLVSTDDELIIKWAQLRGYFVRRRPVALAGDTSIIKEVAVDLVARAHHVHPTDYLWLTYMTTVFKNLEDFRATKALIERINPPAFCTFLPVQTHPYITWHQDPISGKMRQFVPNNIANRQALPPAHQNFHYLSGFKAETLPRLNSNLLCEDTYPIFFDEEQRDRICDLDTPSDLVVWQKKHPVDFERWQQSLPSDLDLDLIAPYIGRGD